MELAKSREGTSPFFFCKSRGFVKLSAGAGGISQIFCEKLVNWPNLCWMGLLRLSARVGGTKFHFAWLHFLKERTELGKIFVRGGQNL